MNVFFKRALPSQAQPSQWISVTKQILKIKFNYLKITKLNKIISRRLFFHSSPLQVPCNSHVIPK